MSEQEKRKKRKIVIRERKKKKRLADFNFVIKVVRLLTFITL